MRRADLDGLVDELPDVSIEAAVAWLEQVRDSLVAVARVVDDVAAAMAFSRSGAESDLSLEATVCEGPNGVVHVEIDNIHVL